MFEFLKFESMDEMPVWEEGEEILNSVSHAVGFGIILCTALHLMIKALKQQDKTKLFSYTVFNLCMMMLFGTSMVYHGVKEGTELKKFLRYMDHCSIYLGIAGSYTPAVLGTLDKSLGIFLFVVEWLLAIIGIFFKVCYFNSFQTYSLYFFIIMGWVALLALPQMWKKWPKSGFFWVLMEALIYTAGTYFFSHEKKYYHFIWHLAVIGGAISHIMCIEFCL